MSVQRIAKSIAMEPTQTTDYACRDHYTTCSSLRDGRFSTECSARYQRSEQALVSGIDGDGRKWRLYTKGLANHGRAVRDRILEIDRVVVFANNSIRSSPHGTIDRFETRVSFCPC